MFVCCFSLILLFDTVQVSFCSYYIVFIWLCEELCSYVFKGFTIILHALMLWLQQVAKKWLLQVFLFLFCSVRKNELYSSTRTVHHLPVHPVKGNFFSWKKSGRTEAFKQKHHTTTHCFQVDFWEVQSRNTAPTKMRTNTKHMSLKAGVSLMWSLWQTHTADQEAANLFYYSLETENVHVHPLTFITHSGRGVWLISLNLPRWHLCLTLHTHCWLVIPLGVSSTNQGPSYNHTHQITAHHWATEINKGKAQFFLN